jgi:YidC/Oxa1 family membrane protein insertase
MQPPVANIFQPLINVFDAILNVFHDDIGLGWGLAIIALTLLIRSLLLPLTLKQLRSMYRMAQFTPQIKKLRDKHGSEPPRLQRETRAFYKQNRISPLGWLLPAPAQLPVFLSVYFMLRTDLRHDICPSINPPRTSNPQPCGETAASHFLFISDLTSRATGAVLVALIVLYVGSQLFSFLLSANPTMDNTQRMIFSALPFFFITIAWQLPAGLPVYWITTNAWTIGQGAIVHKRLGHLRQAAQDAQAPAGGHGGPADRFKQPRGEDRASHRPQAEGRAPAATRRRRSRPARALAAARRARAPRADSGERAAPRRRRAATRTSAPVDAGERARPSPARPPAGCSPDKPAEDIRNPPPVRSHARTPTAHDRRTGCRSTSESTRTTALAVAGAATPTRKRRTTRPSCRAAVATRGRMGTRCPLPACTRPACRSPSLVEFPRFAES